MLCIEHWVAVSCKAFPRSQGWLPLQALTHISWCILNDEIVLIAPLPKTHKPGWEFGNAKQNVVVTSLERFWTIQQGFPPRPPSILCEKQSSRAGQELGIPWVRCNGHFWYDIISLFKTKVMASIKTYYDNFWHFIDTALQEFHGNHWRLYAGYF